MDVSDKLLVTNRDWDPSYLQLLFDEDFNDHSDLWKSNVSDEQLVTETVRVEHEKYQPITEDISLEDDILCSAVEKIEEEWVQFLFAILVSFVFKYR